MKSTPWYQQFQIIAYVVAGLTALGGAVVVASKYINLPSAQAETQKQVEKVQGDVADLKGWAREIQGYTRATQQMQQQVPNQRAPSSLRECEEGDIKCWCCDLSDRQACFDRNLWFHCG